MPLFSLFKELRLMVSVGIPIFIAQLTQIGMNFVDTLMAGQYSAEALAAVAVAGSIWLPLTLFGVGCLLALPGMTAQMVGARQNGRTMHLLAQGILLSALLSLVLLTLLYFLSCNMGQLGLDDTLAVLAGAYMRALLPGLPAFFLFVVVRSFLEGFAKTRPAMVVSIFALLVNIPCNYALIYGKWGAPELGAVGCGIATSICYWVMALALVVYTILFVRRFMRSAIPAVQLDFPLIVKIFRIGLPNALAICLECSLYAMSALLLAPLGAMVVAGHQVTMSYAGVVFTLPLSIGMTTTIRVGQFLGAEKLHHARMAAWVGLLLGVLCAVSIMVVTIVFREPIVRLYNNDAAVVSLACELMLLCAAYQLFDVVQNISCGVLRGYNDTRVISFVCTLAYGVIGLPAGYILARTDWVVPALGAAGFWWGYTLALLCSSFAFLARVRLLHRLDLHKIRTMIVQ